MNEKNDRHGMNEAQRCFWHERQTGCDCHALVLAEAATPPPALDWARVLTDVATEFWSDEAIRTDGTFHPSLLWRFIDLTRARLSDSEGERHET